MQEAISKYFIAIVPGEPLQEEIMNLKQYIHAGYTSKGALRSPAHITLHMPFEWKEKKEHELIAKISKFRFAPDHFTIELKNYACFEPRGIFLDVQENGLLKKLQKEFVNHAMKELNSFNKAEDKRGFHPHSTRAVMDLKTQMGYKAWREFKHRRFFSMFHCSSIF